MKKIYLLIITMAILLAGCMSGSKEQGYYEESVLLSTDTTINFEAVLEEAQPIYALEESAPVMEVVMEVEMEVEMVEERSMSMKSLEEPNTLEIKQDTSKILNQKNEDLSNKELRFKKDVQNQYKQEEINKNLDKLEEQQIMLDSLLKKKKDEI